MAHRLPDISKEHFYARLAAMAPERLTTATLAALYSHYRELRTWNRKMSLVGPGREDDILARHYGEALASLPLLKAKDGVLVDVGSGAGFPGFVVAAARPRLAVFLVEARERKWAFLRAASRRCSVPCTCLLGRVSASLPRGFPAHVDVVTSRAVKIEPELLGGILRGAPRARFLLWRGRSPVPVPAGYRIGQERPLPGTDGRCIVELEPAGTTSAPMASH